jgi:cellulose synthase/poly-beta-1,6-N-acetylglucosamine synthase-like glycosyltransferase
MNWSKWIRQAHRWLSIAFTIAVVINVVALVRQEQAVWVGLLALFPLILLLLSGLYLFVLPYTIRWRGERIRQEELTS